MKKFKRYPDPLHTNTESMESKIKRWITNHRGTFLRADKIFELESILEGDNYCTECDGGHIGTGYDERMLPNCGKHKSYKMLGIGRL